MVNRLEDVTLFVIIYGHSSRHALAFPPRNCLSLTRFQSPQTSPHATPAAAAAPGPTPPASPISSCPRALTARPSAHSQESVPLELRGPGIFVSRTPRPSRT